MNRYRLKIRSNKVDSKSRTISVGRGIIFLRIVQFMFSYRASWKRQFLFDLNVSNELGRNITLRIKWMWKPKAVNVRDKIWPTTFLQVIYVYCL